MVKLVGYARVSDDGQNLDLQIRCFVQRWRKETAPIL